MTTTNGVQTDLMNDYEARFGGIARLYGRETLETLRQSHALVIGVGGVWGLYFIYQLKQRPLFPDNQAFLLPEGHDHAAH